MDSKGSIGPVNDTDYGLACCSRNALTVALAPTVTVRVFCQGVNPLFATLTWWSPGARRSVDGVFPMYLSSTVMSAPSGVDLMSIADSGDALADAAGAGAALAASVGSSANFDASSGISPLV